LKKCAHNHNNNQKNPNHKPIPKTDLTKTPQKSPHTKKPTTTTKQKTETKTSKPQHNKSFSWQGNDFFFYQIETCYSRIFFLLQENFKGTNKPHQCDTT
jgi:hypothetical protein